MLLLNSIPENYFTILTRKNRNTYFYVLLTLYDSLKLFKSKIKRTDFVNMLKTKGQTFLKPFNVEQEDYADNKSDVAEFSEVVSEDQKINYIIRKLIQCGWIEIEKQDRTNIQFIYLPSYTVYTLELISKLACDSSSYVPLIHQTYSELKLEDETQDEFMLRTLLNSYKNAQTLELNVSLLLHSIKVYNKKLSVSLCPNEILYEHFDQYKSEIGDRLYYPMKTYDSFALYTLPVVSILNRWSNDPKIISKLIEQSKCDKDLCELDDREVYQKIISIINKIKDIFSDAFDSFKSIDNENSDYIESVRRKVVFLTKNDRSNCGKIDKLLLTVAREYSENDGDIDKCETIDCLKDLIEISRSALLNDSSLTMPILRNTDLDNYIDEFQDERFLPPEDEIFDNVEYTTEQAALQFIEKQFNGKNSLSTEDILIKDNDDLTLLITALIQSDFNEKLFSKTRYVQQILNRGYELPKYLLEREN